MRNSPGMGRRKYPKVCIECNVPFESTVKTSTCCSRSCAAARTFKVATPKHGMANKVPEYYVWKTMIQRCHNPNNSKYPGWGGRGISVCKSWRDFRNFFADMGSRPTPKHTIERKQNNGNYEPENCVWATKKEQGRNKRNNHLISFNGDTLPLSAWAERIGLSESSLRCRLYREKWTTERALTTPPFYRGQK